MKWVHKVQGQVITCNSFLNLTTIGETKELSKDIGDMIADLHKVGVHINKWKEDKVTVNHPQAGTPRCASSVIIGTTRDNPRNVKQDHIHQESQWWQVARLWFENLLKKAHSDESFKVVRWDQNWALSI